MTEQVRYRQCGYPTMGDPTIKVEFELRGQGLPFTFDLLIEDAERLKNDLGHQLRVVHQRPNRSGTVDDIKPFMGEAVPS
jgi:hypothetical protein